MYLRKLFYYLCCRCFVKEKIDMENKNDDTSNDIRLDISNKKDDDDWQQL